MWGTGPLRDGRSATVESGVVHLVDEDTEEGSGLFVRVWLELRVDQDDECGSHGV